MLIVGGMTLVFMLYVNIMPGGSDGDDGNVNVDPVLRLCGVLAYGGTVVGDIIRFTLGYDVKSRHVQKVNVRGMVKQRSKGGSFWEGSIHGGAHYGVDSKEGDEELGCGRTQYQGDDTKNADGDDNGIKLELTNLPPNPIAAAGGGGTM